MKKNINQSLKNKVYQSNALIQAHYKQEYSVQEQRTILWIISEVHKEAYFLKKIHVGNFTFEHKVLRISAQKYADIMNIDVKNVYRDAKKISKQLMEKVITIQNEKGWEMFHWVSSMKYIQNEAKIEVMLSENILPHIIDLKNYTEFKLENILHLHSTHAIKIYQLLAQYKKLGDRIISVDELRSILGIVNIKSYKAYGSVKQRILDISEREINAKTDLNISYSEIKKGRKVEAIKFKISQKNLKEKKLISTSFSNFIPNNKIKPLVLEKAKQIVLEAKTGWDLYAIEQQFYGYIEYAGFPKNLETAFLGFVKKKVKVCP